MLSKSHNRAYQEFLTLLSKFQSICADSKAIAENTQIEQQFLELKQWFEQNIASLDAENLEVAIATRWQSVQTEIKREFRLLATDMLFLSSSRQEATRVARLKAVVQHLAKLIDYCKVMLDKN